MTRLLPVWDKDKADLLAPKVSLVEAAHGEKGAIALSRTDYGVVIALLSILWALAVPLFAERINTLGACATGSCAGALGVVSAKYKNNPSTLRLSDSYEVWERNLFGMDMADYIEAGIVYAGGHGLALRGGTPGNIQYIPFCYHPPLTPFVIGTFIRLFGDKCVFPYFLLICLLQYFSAIISVALAGNLVKTRSALMLAGLLSLFCWPALEYTFGVGLFSSEAIIYPFFGLSLLSLAAYRKKVWNEAVGPSAQADKSIVSSLQSYGPYAMPGGLFGACITVAAYARDLFSGFATFAAVVVTLKGLFKRKILLQSLTFAVISILVLHALEAPWERRNQKILGARVMSIVSWNYYVLWGWCTWPEADVLRQSDEDACIGVGTFIAPEMQPAVEAALKNSVKDGGIFAAKTSLASFIKHPLEAIKYRAKYYDCIWFGHRKEVFIYLWSVLSAAFFGAFVFLNRGRFYHELYIYPLYMLGVSTMIQYDPRFCFAFYVFITPVCAAAVIDRWITGRLKSLPSSITKNS